MTDSESSNLPILTGRAVAAMVVVLLLAPGCGEGNNESQASTTTTAVSAPTTTTTSVPATTSTTVAPTTTSTSLVTREPPVIHLAGYTTVYSQDGTLRVSGWLDRPAVVMVGDTAADVLDDQYSGISTFETVLDLQPGSYAIIVTATDADGLENYIVLSVLVDPALEVRLAMIQDVDLVERTLVADYVEFLTGDEATIAAREDGVIGEAEEVPGGFYVRNRDPELYNLAVGDPGMVTLQACFPESGPCVVEQAVDVDTWVELRADPELAEERAGWAWYGDALAPYWLTLQDGMIVQISEQYLP